MSFILCELPCSSLLQHQCLYVTHDYKLQNHCLNSIPCIYQYIHCPPSIHFVEIQILINAMDNQFEDKKTTAMRHFICPYNTAAFNIGTVVG